ncbi:MAG: GTP cyclohydrolase I FolE [Armatimonadetes bacterium]|nr:GTP cyclohydrolase I FolE [Armatimonadota bacterium]
MPSESFEDLSLDMSGEPSALEGFYRRILAEIGEEPRREGLVKTPRRAAEAIRFLTKGYEEDVKTILNGAVFEEDYQDMVIVKGMEFYSLCEHHLLPFFGKTHVGYIPDGRIVGISKIARLVEMFSRRLQVQERMTEQIARALEEALRPVGVAVVMEAQHLCMMARGIQKQSSKVVTSSVLGVFRDDRATRDEFMELVKLDDR